MRDTTTRAALLTPGGFHIGDTNSGNKTTILARLIEQFSGGARPASILVVGCGNGDDAAALARHFDCRSIGIDLEDYYERRNDQWVDFRAMDACDLQLPSASFDLVFSFHALEHIPQPERALAEIRRVLRDGGFYCIGTPNRSRAVGYIGVPGYPLAGKIRSNARDWGDRLKGRFRNEYGAHAGFTGRELTELCGAIGPGRNISDAYYRTLYARRGRVIEGIIRFGLQGVAWPSVYVFGSKPPAA